ncbi:hypothetical protein K504DRAFT_444935 [Pleomassaria siparia CBS 279.74]|uniref:Uncharacterized protein n=1 Tax=Pleomassaria siparia CBS 279.74 TaxID=1314801 RepID=A0A6G1JRI0_9PLEO|nr:hypothetical protein K504DRAFT_444935 [Pleomassaria siparia CBS 279.74]
MKGTFVVLAVLHSIFATTALAGPVANTPPYHHHPSQKTYVAQYDDLPFVEPGPNPLPSPYNGLVYNLFQVDQYDGFIPTTSGNQWTMAFGGSGNFSVPATPAKQTFTLSSFSYACDGGISQPECAISVWGFKDSGQVVKRVITYPRLDPGHVIEDFKMNATTFSRGWSGLKSVGFSIARADNAGDMFAGLALDDVRYTVVRGR